MNKSFRFFLSCILIFSLLIPHIPICAIGTESLDDSISDTGSSTAPPAVNSCQILNYIDKEVFANGNHIERLTDEETLSTYVFLNSDGSKTVYYLDEPVKYVDATGNILEKNLSLTESSNGYVTTQNNITLSLPSNPSSGIHLSYPGNIVSLIPQGGTLAGTAQKSGNTLIYPNYYGKGISLAYTPTLSGVKEDIILTSYTGTNSFTFILNTSGLNLYQSGENWYLAESEFSETRISLGQVVTYDARGRFSIGTMTAEPLLAGRSYRVTITADESFLTAETTTYPVTIDPTLAYTDSSYSSNTIEDATVYEGKPNLNTGTWLYHHIGHYDDEYGIGQTVVRLSNFISSDVYRETTANAITSAKFYVREASGNPSGTVNLYPIVTNVSWTESGITWNNKGSYGTTAYASTTLPSNKSAYFDITQLVSDWKHGQKNATAGFVLVASPSNSDVESLYSSEYSTNSYRPYLSVTYKNSIQLNKTSAELHTGDTFTLTASTGVEDYSTSWSSSDMSVATIRKTGDYTCEVTAVNPGTATITATLGDGSVARCTVYVLIADGIYRISNNNFCLGIDSISSGSPTKLFTPNNEEIAKLRQLWKIEHIAQGTYTIRPMYKLDMGLCYGGTNVRITQTSVTTASPNAFTELSSAHLWRITKLGSGYYIQNAFTTSSNNCLTPAGGTISSGHAVITGALQTDNPAFVWSLTRDTSVTEQILLLDSETGLPVDNASRFIELGSTVYLSDLNLSVSVVSPSSNYQSVDITSDTNGSNILDISSSGQITGLLRGQATITISGGSPQSTASFSVIVCETISVINLYDSTVDANIVSKIPTAINFLNKIYNNTFFLYFEMDGSPVQYADAAVDICENGDRDGCRYTNYHSTSCSSKCPEHHKNVYRIAEDLYYEFFEKNHVTVMWSNCKEEIYCVAENTSMADGSISPVHTPLISEFAIVIFEEDDSDERTFTPVVQILTIDRYANLSDYTGSAEAYMSLILAHEIAHTLGMSDVYDYSYYANVPHAEGKWSACIMDAFSKKDCQTFYQNVCSGQSGLCDACIQLLQTEILDDVYEN